jgi:uncharacterized protein (DUF885 family)
MTQIFQIVKSLGHESMPLKDFMDMIRDDKSQYYSSTQEVVDAFKDICENQVMPRLGKIFHQTPKHKLE